VKDETIPTGPYGRSVPAAPNEIRLLYDEARHCCATGAYSSAVLMCRKLLMHISHDLSDGDLEGKNLRFVQYVEWLGKHHYLPRDGADWVDWIRQRGNQENHELVVANQDDAEQLIDLLYGLLLWNYELHSKLGSPNQRHSPS
jgi:hypothetical protein